LGEIIAEDFNPKGNEYSPGELFSIFIIAIPSTFIFYLFYFIVSLIAQFVVNRKYVPIKKNWLIILTPAVFFVVAFMGSIRKEGLRVALDAETNLFEASLIESQRACGHSDQLLYFKKNGQFLKHDYDRFSDDFCWTGYTIKRDTIFFKKKFSLMPSDIAIIKKDTLRFKGDTLVYKINSSSY